MQSLRRLTTGLPRSLHFIAKTVKKEKPRSYERGFFLIECGNRGFYDYTLFSLQTIKLSAPDAVANLKYVAPIAFME